MSLPANKLDKPTLEHQDAELKSAAVDHGDLDLRKIKNEPIEATPLESISPLELREAYKHIISLLTNSTELRQQDEWNRSASQLSLNEEHHRELTKQIFPNYLSPQITTQFSEAFYRLIRAAKLSTESNLTLFGSEMENAYVFRRFEQSNDGENQKLKTDYSQCEYDARSVFLSIGLIHGIAKFIEQEARDSLRIKAQEANLTGIEEMLNLPEEEIRRRFSSFSAEKQDKALNIIQAYHVEKLLTIDDIAAVMSHEIQHLRQVRKNKSVRKISDTIQQNHEMELEADLIGMRDIHAKAGFNPRAFNRVIKYISKAGGIISLSHPDSKLRERLVARLIADPETPLKSLTNKTTPIEIKEGKTSLSKRFFEHVKGSKNLEELAKRASSDFSNPALGTLLNEALTTVKLFDTAQGLVDQDNGHRLVGLFIVQLGLAHISMEEDLTTDLNHHKKEQADLKLAINNISPSLSERKAYLESEIDGEQRVIEDLERRLNLLAQGDLVCNGYISWDGAYDLINVLKQTAPQSSYAKLAATNTTRESAEASPALLKSLDNFPSFVAFSRSSNSAVNINQIDKDELTKIGGSWRQEEPNSDPILEDIIQRGIKCLEFLTSGENSTPNLSPEARVIHGAVLLCRSKISHVNEAPNLEVYKNLITLLTDRIASDNPEVSADNAARIAAIAADLILEKSILKFEEDSSFGQTLGTDHFSKNLEILVKTLVKYSVPPGMLIQDLPLGDASNIPKTFDWIPRLNTKLMYNQIPINIPFGALDEAIETLHRLSCEQFYLASIARLQSPPEISQINSGNIGNAILTISGGPKSSNKLISVAQIIPTLSLSLDDARRYRRQIVESLVGDNDALLELYEVKKKEFFLTGAEALYLTSCLAKEGISEEAFHNGIRKITLDLNGNDHLANSTLLRLKNLTEPTLSRKDLNDPLSICGDDELNAMALATGIPRAELIPLLPEMGIVLYLKSLNSSSGQYSLTLTPEELSSYAFAFDRARKSDNWLRDIMTTYFCEHHAEALGVLLIKRCIPDIHPSLLKMIDSSSTLRDIWPAIALNNIPLPSEETLLSKLPPSTTRDWLQVCAWQQAGEDKNQAIQLLTKLSERGDAASESTSISIHASALIIAIERGQNDQSIKYAIEQYDIGAKPNIRSAIIQGKETPYSTLTNHLYAQEPGLLYDSSTDIKSRIEQVCTTYNPSELRDHILEKELTRELCRELDIYFYTHFEELETLSPLRTDLRVSCPLRHAERFTALTPEQLSRIPHQRLLEMSEAIAPHLSTSAKRETLARLVLQELPSSSLERELQLITQYLPDVSLVRDHYLKRLTSRYSISIPKLREIKTLMSDIALTKGGIESVTFFGAQVLARTIERFSTEQRTEMATWLCGLQKETPWYLKAAGGLAGVTYDSIPSQFSRLTKEERSEILRALFIGDKALFEANSKEEIGKLREFVENLIEKAVPGEIEFKDTIRKIGILLFEYARPERRLHYFEALSKAFFETQSSTQDKESQGYEVIALFLEQTGPLGCKLMQMLCNNNSLPIKLREAFARRRSNTSEISKTAISPRVEDDDSFSEPDKLTIGTKRGSASMKQAHDAQYGDLNGILKALKPTVEKYYSDDYEVVEKVIQVLRDDGISVPRFLLLLLQEIVIEESQLDNEAELQYQLSEQLKQTTINGVVFSTPEIIHAAKDWALETRAEGSSLAELSNSKAPEDIDAYHQASTNLGLLLAQQLSRGERFHADLHDENAFFARQLNKQTLIDCGAVGQSDNSVLRVLGAVIRVDATTIVEELERSSVAHNLQNKGEKDKLTERIDLLLRSPYSIEEKANRLSYEILENVLPSKSIRYLFKALGSGGHHLAHIKPSMQDIREPKRLLEKVKTLAGLGIAIWKAK